MRATKRKSKGYPFPIGQCDGWLHNSSLMSRDWFVQVGTCVEVFLDTDPQRIKQHYEMLLGVHYAGEIVRIRELTDEDRATLELIAQQTNEVCATSRKRGTLDNLSLLHAA